MKHRRADCVQPSSLTEPYKDRVFHKMFIEPRSLSSLTKRLSASSNTRISLRREQAGGRRERWTHKDLVSEVLPYIADHASHVRIAQEKSIRRAVCDIADDIKSKITDPLRDIDGDLQSFNKAFQDLFQKQINSFVDSRFVLKHRSY